MKVYFRMFYMRTFRDFIDFYIRIITKNKIFQFKSLCPLENQIY